MKVTLVCAAVITSGCESMEDAHLPVPPPFPETIKAGLERVNVAPPCVVDQDHYVNPVFDADGDRPVKIQACIPPYLDELQRHTYEAACVSSFHLTEQGETTDIETFCNVIHDYGRNTVGIEIAEAMFVRLMDRATAERRYAPAVPGESIDTNKVIYQPLKFAHEGSESYLRYPDITRGDTVE